MFAIAAIISLILFKIAIDMREDLFPGEEDNTHQNATSEPIAQRYVPSSVRGNIRRRQFIETHF